MDKYILASQSPRRRELLAAVIKEYDIVPAKGDENVDFTDPGETVKELSLRKAVEVAESFNPGAEDRVIVIGADTVVAVDGEILGKPVDRADAKRMISLIQGREHHVYTGVTVCWTDPTEAERPLHSFSFCEETAVEVFPMTREEIDGYVSLEEPYDKAGAYGIQGAFCVFIKGIRGDYNNVVGLPVARLYHEMAARGLVRNANLR